MSKFRRARRKTLVISLLKAQRLIDAWQWQLGKPFHIRHYVNQSSDYLSKPQYIVERCKCLSSKIP